MTIDKPWNHSNSETPRSSNTQDIENILVSTTKKQKETYTTVISFLSEDMKAITTVEERRWFLRIMIDKNSEIPASIVVNAEGKINITIDPVKHKKDFQYRDKEGWLTKDNCETHIQALPSIVNGEEPDEILFRKKEYFSPESMGY